MLTAIIFSGCDKDSFCNCLENTGNTISETRPLPDFSKIEMDNNIDIYLTPSNDPQATVTCGKNLVDGIRTEVRGDVLYIHNKNKCNWLRDFKNKFTVQVGYRQLESIINRGSGNLNCTDTLRSGEFLVESWNGTGILDFIIDCDEVYFKLHTGPADIYASGKTNTMYIYTAGNGYVKTAAVQSQFTYVTTKSTGNCEVNAIKELDAVIQYHGNVYYNGEPEIINTKITGSGKLIRF